MGHGGGDVIYVAQSTLSFRYPLTYVLDNCERTFTFIGFLNVFVVLQAVISPLVGRNVWYMLFCIGSAA